MSFKKIKITRADWDFRTQTPLLVVEGVVMATSPGDEVTTVFHGLDPPDPAILGLRIAVRSAAAKGVPQPVPFYFRVATTGSEGWKRIRAVWGQGGDTAKITRLEWA